MESLVVCTYSVFQFCPLGQTQQHVSYTAIILCGYTVVIIVEISLGRPCIRKMISLVYVNNYLPLESLMFLLYQ